MDSLSATFEWFLITSWGARLNLVTFWPKKILTSNGSKPLWVWSPALFARCHEGGTCEVWFQKFWVILKDLFGGIIIIIIIIIIIRMTSRGRGVVGRIFFYVCIDIGMYVCVSVNVCICRVQCSFIVDHLSKFNIWTNWHFSPSSNFIRLANLFDSHLKLKILKSKYTSNYHIRDLDLIWSNFEKLVVLPFSWLIKFRRLVNPFRFWLTP